MNLSEDLESLVRRYVILGKRSPKGFESVKCAKCNDYKPRGGFKFEAGNVIYSCFNCSTKAVFEGSSRSLSKSMREILLAFGLPETELDLFTASSFFKPRVELGTAQPKPTRSLGFPSGLALPSGAVPVESSLSPWCEVAQAYLTSRGLGVIDHEFLVTDEASCVGRLIIPYLFRGKVIYWQGRAMDDSIVPRYKNPVVEKENIFFNMDEIYRYTDEPLFIVEGPLDAISIGPNAVAIAGSTLSEFQTRALLQAAQRRRVIFVLDKNPNGYKLGKRVLNEPEPNWLVTCFPDNLDDANDARQKLGKLWVTVHLASTAVNGLRGNLLLELNCK